MPEPYYRDEAVVLYHGDALELLPLVAASATRLISDPPYSPFIASQLSDWVITRETVAIFGYPEMLVGWCVEAGVKPSEWVVWAPQTPRLSSGGSGLPKWSEHVAIFGSVVGGRDIRIPRSERSARMAYLGRRGDPAYARAGDTWTDSAPGIGFQAHRRLHPNEKPLSLMRKLVTLCSLVGDTVLDPFMGSGTTLRAAKDLGRRAIGIELEERYCEIAARRMGQEVLAL